MWLSIRTSDSGEYERGRAERVLRGAERQWHGGLDGGMEHRRSTECGEENA